MNKAEALLVLYEIFDACNESVILNSVSIDPISCLAKKNVEG
jgi:hypothetical protein